MSNYSKPQSPLYHKEKDTYFYPLTTVDQIIMEDNSRLSGANFLSVEKDNTTEGNITPVNADTLGGKLASEYATQNFVTTKIAEAQLGGEDGTIDLGGYATKDELTEAIDNINHPVINVNGKTGEVQLTAEDVGAVTPAEVNNAVKKAAPRNHLINSDFRNPVNRNGQTVYTKQGYTIDKWHNDFDALTIYVEDGYLKIVPTLNTNFSHVVRDYKCLLGKTITYTLKADGNINFVVGAYVNGNMQYWYKPITNGLAVGSCFIPENAESVSVYIQPQDTNECRLYWTALYEGEYTEDTLPEYQPKGYENELLVCRQYDPNTGEYIGLRKFSQPRNILINSNFINPVNQSGKTTWNTDGYTVDMWRMAVDIGVINIVDDGLQLDATNNAITLFQMFEDFMWKQMISSNKKYTWVINYTVETAGSENMYIFQRIKDTTVKDAKILDKSVGTHTYVSTYIPDATDGTSFYSPCWFYVTQGFKVILHWVALYEGEFNADTIPEYQPKGYENELLICRQYDSITGEYIGLRKFGQPRNLMDNSDFTNPVNQRGSGITSTRYARPIDRWLFDNGGDSQAAAGYDSTNRYVVIDARRSTNGFSALYHAIEAADIEPGEYTIAFHAKYYSDNKNVQMLVQVDGTTIKMDSKLNPSNNNGLIFMNFTVTNKPTTQLFIAIYALVGNYICLDWGALYKGTYTAETMPEYQPKGYGSELMECMRYYQRVDGHYITGQNTTIQLIPAMRVLPTIIKKRIEKYTNSSWEEITDNNTVSASTVNCIRVHIPTEITNINTRVFFEASADL